MISLEHVHTTYLGVATQWVAAIEHTDDPLIPNSYSLEISSNDMWLYDFINKSTNQTSELIITSVWSHLKESHDYIEMHLLIASESMMSFMDFAAR